MVGVEMNCMAKIPFSAFALVLFAALLLLFGCVLKDQEDQPIAINDQFAASPLVVPKYLADRKDLICKELDEFVPDEPVIPLPAVYPIGGHG